MEKVIIKIILTIVLFFFIYNPPISFLPMNSGIITGACFFMFYLLNSLKSLLFSRSIHINRYLLLVTGTVFLIILYSFLNVVVSGTFDFQVCKSYLSFILFYIPGAFGIVHILKKYWNGVEILKIIIFVTVIQAVIIIIMMVNPGIKDFLFSLLRDGSARIEKNISSGGFRFLGFAFNSTWDLAIVQSIGIMLICVLFKTDKNEINIKNALFFILLAISVFLSGRTGMLGIVFGFLIIIIPSNLKEMPFVKMTKFITKIFMVILPLFFFAKSFIPDSVVDIVETNVLPWAFEMFLNDNGGKLETNSSNELKEMYFMPPVKTLIVGDALYVNPYDNTRYYMDTDAGYMRHVLFYGIFGCFLTAVLYVMIFYQMFNFSRTITNLKSLRLFVVFLCIYYFVSQIKGDLFVGADQPIKILFLLYALFLSLSKSNDLEKNNFSNLNIG